MLAEGWYLMNTRELERALALQRAGTDRPDEFTALSTPDALAYRDAGNVPDEEGRTLRLVLHVRSRAELLDLDEKRRRFEPNFHDEPSWRRAGSRPVNVVPLRIASESWASEESDLPWWTDPGVGPLERAWRSSGRVAGIVVPAGVRSFVFKTVIALEKAGIDVTIESIVASIRRWLPEEDASAVERELYSARGREEG